MLLASHPLVSVPPFLEQWLLLLHFSTALRRNA
jgi:hypothetical protein